MKEKRKSFHTAVKQIYTVHNLSIMQVQSKLGNIQDSSALLVVVNDMNVITNSPRNDWSFIQF